MKYRSALLALAVLLTLPAGATAANTVKGSTPEVVASGRAHQGVRVARGRTIGLTLVLQPRNQSEFQQVLHDVLDPASPRFHDFLTFNEWKSRYAPTDADVAKVTGWAKANGLAPVHRFRNNLAFKIRGTAQHVEQAFDVQLHHYTEGARHFISNDRDPEIPAVAAGVLKDVQGLNTYVQVRGAGSAPALAPAGEDAAPPSDGPVVRETTTIRDGAEAHPSICCGQTAGTLELPDLQTSEAYAYAGLQHVSPCCNPDHAVGGSPKAAAIAVIGTNKIDTNDLDTFNGAYGYAAHLTQVMIDDPACCDGEMTLDIEAVGAMANSANGNALDSPHVYAYEGGGRSLSDLLDAWEEAQSADAARVATTSFGAFEDQYGGLGNPSISDFSDAINAMTAVGWSIVAAAGDHGAYDDCEGLSVNFPASNPNVVAVGGTTLSMTNNGGKPKYASEVSWTGNGCGGSDWPGSNNGGGGGGCADTEPAGFWQAIVTLPCSKRALPDIAMNSGTGVSIYWLGSWQGIAGTSAAAPEFAGFLARENAYLSHLGNVCGASFAGPCAPIGMPNAFIWLMGNAGVTANGHSAFYDITSGCNGGSQGQGYCTSAGYDLATGWGSINALQLAWGLTDAVSHGVIPEVSFSGATANQWYNADRHIDYSIRAPSPQGTFASVGIAGHTAQWDTVVADPKTHPTPGSGDAFYDGPVSTASSGFLSLATAGEGCHTAHVRAWDNAGETSDDKTFGPVCYDNEPPVVFCAPIDTFWQATDVSVNCGAVDHGPSGLLHPEDASFQLTTSVAAGTETDTAFTGSHQVCDLAGNCATAGPLGPTKVDKKAPSITITTPTATQYTVKQVVNASYACTDGGSGVAACAGPVASGSPIDTVTVGTKTFTVNAADVVANPSSKAVSYAVTYRICLKYDATKASTGRAYAFTIQLCDANNKNVSLASIAVTATGVDGIAAKAKPIGSLNPGNKFLYGPGTAPGASYLYNLDTLGLTSGAHVLNFTVQGDPIPHTVPFKLKK